MYCFIEYLSTHAWYYFHNNLYLATSHDWKSCTRKTQSFLCFLLLIWNRLPWFYDMKIHGELTVSWTCNSTTTTAVSLKFAARHWTCNSSTISSVFTIGFLVGTTVSALVSEALCCGGNSDTAVAFHFVSSLLVANQTYSKINLIITDRKHLINFNFHFEGRFYRLRSLRCRSRENYFPGTVCSV